MHSPVTIRISHYKLEGRKLISLQIQGDAPELIRRLKFLRGIWWHHTQRIWLMPYRIELLKSLLILLAPYRYTLIRPLHIWLNKEAPYSWLGAVMHAYKSMLKLRFPKPVVRQYCSLLHDFLHAHPAKRRTELGQRELGAYLAQSWRNWHKRPEKQYQLIMALGLYFHQLLGHTSTEINLSRYLQQYRLDEPVRRQDIDLLLASASQLDHKTMLTLAYVGGLHLSDIAGLELIHLDMENKQMLISEHWRDKRSYCTLPDPVVDLLIRYLTLYQPEKWLFERSPGKPYTERSIRNIFNRCKKRAALPDELYWRDLRRAHNYHK